MARLFLIAFPWFPALRMRAWGGVVLTVGLLALLPVAGAETKAGTQAATTTQTSTAAAASGQVIRLGSSIEELTGPWKFRTGDNMAWAQPDYNDSGWGELDMAPPQGSFDPYLGTSGFVPGWTVRGYPAYSGYAWYRLRVNLQGVDGAMSSSPLTIKMPDDVDDAYQVFVNGRQIGSFGRFHDGKITTYMTLPRAFDLPGDIRGGPVTIAIRVWMDEATRMINPDTGGLHGPPVLGFSGPVHAMLELDWAAVARAEMSSFAELGVVLLGLLVVLVLYWLDRHEKAYFWLALTLAVTALGTIMGLIPYFHTWIPATPGLLLTDAILLPLLIALWVLFWATWFRLGHMPRLRGMVWSIAGLLAISVACLRAPLYGSLIPVQASLALVPLVMLLKLLLGGLLVWVTWEGVRKDAAGGWMALPAVALVAASIYEQNMLILHVPLKYFFFGYSVSLGQIGVVASLNIITVLLMRRFFHSLQKREHLQQEVEQAREVQKLLIPEALPTIPGFLLESEYRPALQVGGDFFQILPDGAGGVLVVLGDVTGKGLQAGMLVALLVGAIRTIVETSFEPSYVLEALNRRLCGRGQSFATCVALHVSANGETAIANAGHLPPYLNKKEVATEGNLPLGMTDTIRFDSIQLTMQPGDRLTVLTDGVVEARNAAGELFGFNHARAISHLPAAFIARAAQIFGQDDDITVLSISRQSPDGLQHRETVPFTTRPAEA